MVGKASGKRKYYYCPRTTKDGGHRCDMPHFRAELTDRTVWEWLAQLALHPGEIRRRYEEYKAERGKRAEPLWRQAEAADQGLAEHRQKLERLLDLYLSADLDKETYLGRKADLEALIAAEERIRARLLAALGADAVDVDISPR